MMEAIKTLNSYGLEVTSGIILGLDTDTADTESRLKDFIDLSQIPILTINLLQALPKTPLWDRLAKDGRLTDDPELESNVRFLRPYDEVVATWRRCIAHAYDPERLFARFTHQVDATYANRMIGSGARQADLGQSASGAAVAGVQVIWRRRHPVGLPAAVLAGVRAMRCAAARSMRALGMGFVAYHLIQFSREACAASRTPRSIAGAGARAERVRAGELS